MRLTPQRRRGRLAALKVLRQLPRFLRLVVGLMRDSRVSKVDKALLAAVIVYVASPLDLIPDFVAFLGLTDDVFLLGLALNRLVDNAGRDVLLDHWTGSPKALDALLDSVEDIGALIPSGVRKLLRGRVARD